MALTSVSQQKIFVEEKIDELENVAAAKNNFRCIGKFVALKCLYQKKRRSQGSDLSFQLKKLKKHKQMELKVNKNKDNSKYPNGISATENTKTGKHQ